MENNVSVKRGEVWVVDFEDGEGSEQRGLRPALIVQNNKGNENSDTTIVACITSKQKRIDLKTHVLLSKDWLQTDSVVLCEQIATIDKERLRNKLGKLNAHDMKYIDIAIRISLGVGYGRLIGDVCIDE